MSMDKSPLKKKKWNTEDIPDQRGKRVIITGANSGLGLFASRIFAAKGAEVIMAVRNMESGEQALTSIKERYPESTVQLMKLDLASLKSIREFANTATKNFEKVDVLMNNAGVMQPPYSKTEDGFELQFGVNHLGHFALTGLLLPLLDKAGRARVVTQSSMAHLTGRINFDDINSEKKYGRTKAYSQSKIANLYFAYELNRRLSRINSEIISIAVHPGYTNTELQSKGPALGGRTVLSRIYSITNKIVAQSVEKGSLPMLYAGTMDDVRGGDYIGPSKLVRGYPRRVKSNKRSYDEEIAKKLWELSEELTQVEYNL